MKTISLEIKKALWEKARQKLHMQVTDIRSQLEGLSEARAMEGKSSAGDKYETQLEMIKQNQDLLGRQLMQAKQMSEQLASVPLRGMETVGEGTLMQLPIGLVWVSIPLGKLEHEGHEYHLVSKESPLFLQLKNLKEGEMVSFRGKSFVLEALI